MAPDEHRRSPRRPRAEGAERASTHDALALAGLELIEAVGFDAASPSRIAAAAGVTERTFFRYFPRKELVLHPDRADVLGLLPDAHARLIDPFVAFETGLRRLIEWRGSERDLWCRRYAVIDADARLAAFDRSLDAELIDRISAAYLADGANTPDRVIEARSIASMLTVGGSCVLRYVAAGDDADPLIEHLLRRARAASTAGAPAPAPDVAVVIVGNGDQSVRRRITDAVAAIDWAESPGATWTAPHPIGGTLMTPRHP